MRRFALLLFAAIICTVLFSPVITHAAEIRNLKQPTDVKAKWHDRSTIIVTATSPQGNTKEYKFHDSNLDNNWNFRIANTCTFQIPISSVTENHNELGISDDAQGTDTHIMQGGTQSNQFDHDDFTEFSGKWGYLRLFQLKTDVQADDVCILKYGAISYDSSTTSNSQVYGAAIGITDEQYRRANFGWADTTGKRIVRTDRSGDWNFNLCDEKSDPRCNDLKTRYAVSEVWLREKDGDGCADVLTLGSTPWAERDGPLLRGVIRRFETNRCAQGGSDIDVFMSTARGKVDAQNPVLDPAAVETRDSGKSCEETGGVLSWIVCPVIKLLDEAAALLDEQISNLLNVPDPTQDNNLYTAWGRMRNIALIILIPIMLIMVLGTALGFSFIDAYTVRKAMPRFLIAVVFITLSWPITAFMINATNEIGQGILGLMTQPFGGHAATLSDLVSAGEGAALSGTGFVIFGGLVFSGFITFGIILSWALVMVVALLVGFAVLTLRQMLILVLIIFAPLAIIAWIFPGNDKLWKLWWGTFTKLLLMYPLIMILIGAGKVFALVMAGSTLYEGVNGFIKQLMVITAYIIPYFFIPFTFKAAGGVFGALTGMVNDRSRGLFDRQKQKRAETRKETHERAGMGRRFNPTGRLAGFNKMSGAVADPMNTARIKMNTPRGRALASELTQKSAAQAQDLAKWMSTAGFNQEALTEIMAVAKENGGRITNDGIQRGIKRLEDKGGTQNRAGAEQLRNSAAFLEETWRSEDFGRAHVGMAAGLAKASQGFLNSEDEKETATYTNYLNDIYGGLGDTFKTQAGLMNAQGGGLSKVGYSEQVDKNGRLVAGGTAARAVQLSRTSVQELAGAKASQISKHFIDNGAMDALLDADTSVLNNADGTPVIDPETGKAMANFVDQQTGERIRVTDERKEAILDTVAQAAYGYNTPAETAEVLRSKLKTIIGEVGEDGVALSDIGKKAQQAELKASRVDPRRTGGLDAAAAAAEER